MNSIYNDDLAISNSKKETNTMKNSKNTEQVSRTGQYDEQEDRASLQAAVEAVSIERDDWRNLALDVTSERDELRVTMAARDAEIDILKDKVKRLEQTAVYLSKHLAYISGMNDATNAHREIGRSMDRVRDTIRDERQANENAIGDIINDLENGNY